MTGRAYLGIPLLAVGVVLLVCTQDPQKPPTQVEDPTFDALLARECKERGLARSARVLARSMATQRLYESGRSQDRDALRRKFTAEALRKLRIDAVIAADRTADEEALLELFDHRYGVGGQRVRVRQILVSLAATRDRLAAAGESADDDTVRAAARKRVDALQGELRSGHDLTSLLSKSDDRITRRLLRDPEHKSQAGFLQGYNYRRYGESFANVVRKLAVGGVSGPVESAIGYHLVQIVSRKVTKFEDVKTALQQEIRRGPATPTEANALRRVLFDKERLRQGGNWPIYRGNPALNGVAPGLLGTNFELAWTFETGDSILSSPVVADGIVYIGSSDQSVYAVDGARGKKIWSFATDDVVDAPPLVVDGRVYVGSIDGVFYALDARKGELVWKFETDAKIVGGANYARLADGSLRILVGSHDAKLYCFDADGGKQWEYETGNFINGTPSILRDLAVFGGCDAILHVVSVTTGKKVGTQVELGAECYVANSLALAGNRAYLGHYGNEFLCVDLGKDELVWSYPSRGSFFSSPALAKDRVVFGGRDKKMHCVTRNEGTPIWTFPTRRAIDGSPVICGDKVIFGSGDGRLYILNLRDGKEIWNYEIGRPVSSSPAVVGGMIFIGASDNSLYAFRPR